MDCVWKINLKHYVLLKEGFKSIVNYVLEGKTVTWQQNQMTEQLPVKQEEKKLI